MNTEIEVLSEEDQYAADLAEAEALKPEHRRRKPVEPPAAAPAPTEAPTEAALDADASPAPAPAPTPAPAAAPAPTPAPAAELFPGFNGLPEDTRKAIQAKYEEAESAKRQAADLDRQYKQLHGKTAPLQSAQAKLLADYTRTQQELAKLKKANDVTGGKALRDRIAAMRENFPDDAEVFLGVLNEAQEARADASRLKEELEGKLANIQNRMHFNDAVAEVARAHPDWTTLKTAFDVPTQSFVPKVNTPEAHELCLWANNLDPMERAIIHPRLYSTNASDVIYALNRFKHDKSWAEAIKASQGNVQTAPPSAGTPAPSPSRATLPEVDPDPKRRASPPATSPTRNDASTDEQEYASAVEIWKQRQREKAGRR